MGNDKGQARFLYLGQYDKIGNSGGGGIPSFGFGTTSPSSAGGIRETRAGNENLTWETALKSNVGIEGRLFKDNLLSFSVDFFKEHRKDILMQLNSVPTIIGVAATVCQRRRDEELGV